MERKKGRKKERKALLKTIADIEDKFNNLESDLREENNKRIEMLEEQIKRIVNEKEGENKETRRAELERKMLDKKIETLEKKIVTITKILKERMTKESKVLVRKTKN